MWMMECLKSVFASSVMFVYEWWNVMRCLISVFAKSVMYVYEWWNVMRCLRSVFASSVMYVYEWWNVMRCLRSVFAKSVIGSEPDPGFLATGTKLGEQFWCLYFDHVYRLRKYMIELSTRQLYVFLIAFMTVTHKVCLKKGKKA